MTHFIGDGCPTADPGENALHHLDTVGVEYAARLSDHETALAGGFDIVAPGYWVRPDNASVSRIDEPYRFASLDGRQYVAHRDVAWGVKSAAFYTMREAVEWIGPTR